MKPTSSFILLALALAKFSPTSALIIGGPLDGSKSDGYDAASSGATGGSNLPYHSELINPMLNNPSSDSYNASSGIPVSRSASGLKNVISLTNSTGTISPSPSWSNHSRVISSLGGADGGSPASASTTPEPRLGGINGTINPVSTIPKSPTMRNQKGGVYRSNVVNDLPIVGGANDLTDAVGSVVKSSVGEGTDSILSPLTGAGTSGTSIVNGVPVIGGLARGLTGPTDGGVTGSPPNAPTATGTAHPSIVNGLPLVGGLTNGVTGSTLGEVTGSTVNGPGRAGSSTVRTVPVVGGMASGLTETLGQKLGSTVGEVVGTANPLTGTGAARPSIADGVPLVGGLTNGVAGSTVGGVIGPKLNPLTGAGTISPSIVNGVPLVGGAASGLSGTLGSELGSTVGAVTGSTRTPATESDTDGSSVVNGLPVIGGVAHALTETAGPTLRSTVGGVTSSAPSPITWTKDYHSTALDGVPLLGSAVAGLVDTTRPIVNGAVDSTVPGSLPIVDGITSPLSSSTSPDTTTSATSETRYGRPPVTPSAGRGTDAFLDGALGQVTDTASSLAGGNLGSLPASDSRAVRASGSAEPSAYRKRSSYSDRYGADGDDPATSKDGYDAYSSTKAKDRDQPHYSKKLKDGDKSSYSSTPTVGKTQSGPVSSGALTGVTKTPGSLTGAPFTFVSPLTPGTVAGRGDSSAAVGGIRDVTSLLPTFGTPVSTTMTGSAGAGTANTPIGGLTNTFGACSLTQSASGYAPATINGQQQCIACTGTNQLIHFGVCICVKNKIDASTARGLALDDILDAGLSFNSRGQCVPKVSPSARARVRRQSDESADSVSDRDRCPYPMTACPPMSQYSDPSKLIFQPMSTKKAYQSWECLDVQEELTSCGTCTNDCTTIANVDEVGCDSGHCKIFTCLEGFEPGFDTDVKTGVRTSKCVDMTKPRRSRLETS